MQKLIQILKTGDIRLGQLGWVKAATYTSKSSGITSQERVDGKKEHSRRKNPRPCRAHQGTKFSLTGANALTSCVCE